MNNHQAFEYSFYVTDQAKVLQLIKVLCVFIALAEHHLPNQSFQLNAPIRRKGGTFMLLVIKIASVM